MKVAAWWMVVVAILPLATGCFQLSEKFGCDEGSVELEGACVRGEWNIIGIDFRSNDGFEVEEGDLVRLEFVPSTFGHYIPIYFHLEGYEISQYISSREIGTLDFIANQTGEFSYSSRGSCRIDIPGAGEVMVDCTVFCGETDNGRSGVISVKEEGRLSD